MGLTLTQKIIKDHLVHGELVAGAPIKIRMDQTLTQDATGTMAYLQFEALGLPRVKTELSVSYVDHNTLQMGFRNPDDHRYLRTVAAKYGIVFSPPGTGICHQLHLENFAKPGKTLIGSDSHTPTAGGVGSLAIGAGGLSVALAMAGEPYDLAMPKVVKVNLSGKLMGWASAKDVILELLRRLSVKGGVGRVMEFAGEGVASLTVPERAVITNMGAELGATTSIFPSDDETLAFLKKMGREADYIALAADPDAVYDETIDIKLGDLKPLIACPHMPDRVVPVAELHGLEVTQAAVGSCTNSSYIDLVTTARILKDKKVSAATDLLIAPGSKQVVKMLIAEGLYEPLLDCGARILECTCGPCIGMGGSPVSAGVSVRTFNRNFEGRSGTQDGQVYLASPATAAFAALNGAFTDPDTWGEAPEKPVLPDNPPSIKDLFIFPPADGSDVEILRGPNIAPLPEFAPLGEAVQASVQLKVGDNITTDHIMPAGAQITALRSNIPAISEHVFSRVDAAFVGRIKAAGGGFIIAGDNYGQGSSREHAALAPKYLGVVAVIAKSFARIHRANLVNFGVLPLILVDKDDYDGIAADAAVSFDAKAVAPAGEIVATIGGKDVKLTNDLSAGELEVIRAGGLLNHVRARITQP